MMENIKIRDIFNAALRSEFGLSLHTISTKEARRMRRRCYAWRERARRVEGDKYDCLSFLIKEPEALWIVPRKKSSSSRISVSFIRELDYFEVPMQIKARGKSKVMS